MKQTSTRFDIASSLPKRLAALKISHNLFGKYCDVGSKEICSMLNGTKRVTSSKAELFSRTVESLEKVAHAFSPASLNWRDTDTIRRLASQLESGELLVGIVSNGSMKISGADHQFGQGGW